jgi:predicted GIY-YIG superfamily endonuclease
MTFTVYGIRLKGNKEVRYIGYTRGELAERLRRHATAAIDVNSYSPVRPWVRKNRDNVEIFPIAKCDDETEARRTESVLIALCLRLDHDLLNGAQVPSHLRFVSA